MCEVTMTMWLVCVLVPIIPWAASLECIQCNSTSDVINCPVDNWAGEAVENVPCHYGGCYSTLENIEGKLETFRGCTNSLPGMPYTLPGDGAYLWRGKTINVCVSDDLCNIWPPDRGPIDCYQCMNYDPEGHHYPQCPKDEPVLSEKAYAGECNSTCFTKTFLDDHNRVARGCTDTQWGLPYPLPPDGCYNWEKDVYCVCNTPGCNGRPIGKSTGRQLDDHLYTNIKDDFEEEDGLNRCFECINYDQDGKYYKQCPKHNRVRNAFLSVCNGSCFTHSYDYDDKKVARGCTDTQWGLPNPLPPDGCYTWYSDVWCVCSTTRCNRHPIGVAQDIEFDAHIPAKQKTGPRSHGTRLHQSLPLLVMSGLFIVASWCLSDS